MPALATVAELLAGRTGEEMALNDRHLNPQLGRIVRTLGFDCRWVAGEGAYLVDADGERFLDLLCGYGVFAVGRNHPEVVGALGDVLQAGTPNLPSSGSRCCPGCSPRRSSPVRPRRSTRWCPPTRAPRRSRRR